MMCRGHSLVKRELVILRSRLDRVASDQKHLIKALRAFEGCDTDNGTREEGMLGAPAVAGIDPFQMPLEEDHD